MGDEIGRFIRIILGRENDRTEWISTEISFGKRDTTLSLENFLISVRVSHRKNRSATNNGRVRG